MTKYFRVGERVRNISNGCYNVGDELIIVKDDYSDSIPLLCRRVNDGKEDWVGRTHVKRVSDTSARLTEAEAKVAALEAEVETMKCQIYSLEKNKADTPALAAITQRTFQPKKSPNQRRADVIKRAQEFVVDLERRATGDTANEDGNNTFNYRKTKLTFHVNAEKGVVTALAHGIWGNQVYGKAFAKCDPDDVFNADIGKAIAAGRLYGVDIPREFTKAPMPTEVVVGMRAEIRGNIDAYEDVIVDGKEYCHGVDTIRKNPRRLIRILEDTNAVYV